MLSEADQGLIARVARRVVDLRMTVPAILLLEGSRPLNFLASQTMLFFRPVIESVWASQDYGRFQELLEQRESVEALVSAIEDEEERLIAERTEARRRRRERKR